MRTFRKCRAGLSATAGLSCFKVIYHLALDEMHHVVSDHTLRSAQMSCTKLTTFILLMKQEFKLQTTSTYTVSKQKEVLVFAVITLAKIKTFQ